MGNSLSIKSRNTVNDFIVKGTGVAAVDDVALDVAISALLAYGRGRLVLDGVVSIATAHAIPAGIHVLGLPGSVVEFDGPNGYVRIGQGLYPWQMAGQVSVNSLAVGSEVINSPNLTLAQGDIISIWSSDVLTVTPHASAATYLPLTIEKIGRPVRGASNQWKFNDFATRPYTLGQKIVKWANVARNVIIENVRSRQKSGTSISSGSRSWIFANTDGLRLINFCFDSFAPAHTEFMMCRDVEVTGGVTEEANDLDADIAYAYRFVTNGVVDFHLDGHKFLGSARHHFTTGTITGSLNWIAGQVVVTNEKRWYSGREYYAAGSGTCGATPPTHTSGTVSDGGVSWTFSRTYAGGYYAYGLSRDVLIEHNTFKGQNSVDKNSPYSETGVTFCDTHSFGERLSVRNNKFIVPGGDKSAIAVTVRAEGTAVENNEFYGEGVGKGVLVYTRNVTVSRNRFEGLWRNSVDTAGYDNDTDNSQWIDNHFLNMTGPAIDFRTGGNHVVRGGSMINCATSASGPIARANIAIIGVTSGKTVRISDVYMPLKGNVMAVAIDGSLSASVVELFANNTLDGYGASSLGLWAKNWTTGEVVTVETIRWNAGNEYRALSNATCGATAPTHTSGNVSDGAVSWQWVRAISEAQLAEIQQVWQTRNGKAPSTVRYKLAHGLTTADIGKPIDQSGAIYDDTSSSVVEGILVDVLNENRYCLAGLSMPYQLLPAKINGSYGHADPRDLYWDLSLSGGGKYVTTKPGDSHASAKKILRTYEVTPTYVSSVVQLA